ncbi:hypothetical protein Trichorick_00359 [Candidatus Trichorickettsia mobilis]|uniref:Uncharacterized protein n=1 Tax=Candidatus Trichorickettsia mobilis TaxID=1346319 RepID=A0ABZ0US86_9RICK|nr:hypothetical protein [Candidatus Trichorickettsia mobilis]WPY00481.1 hypothetical protein Trichorick_00359 [Candidatus Trichorickettsia mobilis]
MNKIITILLALAFSTVAIATDSKKHEDNTNKEHHKNTEHHKEKAEHPDNKHETEKHKKHN